MSHFLIYAARLQDAGVCSLWVSLGIAQDHTRLMHVSPDRATPPELAARFPTRTFDLCGTDRVLEQVTDDLIYREGGPTQELVEAAAKAHPLQAQDIIEWWADWQLMPRISDEELAAVEVDERAALRGAERVKAIMHGIEIAKNRDATRTP